MNRLPFVDRTAETRRLARAFGGSAGSFCCLYGRRRTGKSRLLKEVLPARAVFYVGDQREAPLQRAAVATAISAVVKGFDQVHYPDWLSVLERWWREAPEGAVLALDEFPYLAQASPELPSILQKLVDHSTRRIHLIVCGSSQRMMQGLVLDGTAPLFGRAREIIELKPLPACWLEQAMGLSDPIAVLEAYAVWGGIPWYWELASDYATHGEAVRALVLDRMGVLHTEPMRLLQDDLRDTVQSASLLALVGQGCNRMSELAARCEKPSTSLTRPIQRLVQLGLVQRQIPFGQSTRTSKRTLYRLADPFMAFWFRFVEPNRSRLEADRVESVQRDIARAYAGHLAGVWEDLVRQAVPHLGLVGTEWGCGYRWWGTGRDRRPMELDLVAESTDGRMLLVGEAKTTLHGGAIEREQAHLRTKAANLPFASRYAHIETVLFVADDPVREPGVLGCADVLSAWR